jgi:hypothetical protein
MKLEVMELIIALLAAVVVLAFSFLIVGLTNIPLNATTAFTQVGLFGATWIICYAYFIYPEEPDAFNNTDKIKEGEK